MDFPRIIKIGQKNPKSRAGLKLPKFVTSFFFKLAHSESILDGSSEKSDCYNEMIHGRSTTISARLDLFGGLNQQEEEQQ